MSAFLQEFLNVGGVATNPKGLESKNLILIGDFLEHFAKFNLLKDNAILLHPLNYGARNIRHFLYEVGSDETIIALLAFALRDKSELLSEFSKNLDVGNLTSECNLSEEELQDITEFAKSPFALVIGRDLQTHLKAKNIAKILALISQSVEIIFLEMIESKEILDFSAKFSAKELMSGILPLSELESYDGLVVYLQNSDVEILEVSKQFLSVAKVCDDELICIESSEFTKNAKVRLNTDLKGMVGILKVKNSVEGFCYKRVKIKKVA